MKGGCGVKITSQTNMKKREESVAYLTIKPVMVRNPWDGGVMTLKEYFEREEKEELNLEQYNLPKELPKDGAVPVVMNHIRWNSVEYQFLWFDSRKCYCGQSLFYRKKRGKNPWKPIAMDCYLPYEHLLVVADAFEKNGLKGAKYAIGV